MVVEIFGKYSVLDNFNIYGNFSEIYLFEKKRFKIIKFFSYSRLTVLRNWEDPRKFRKLKNCRKRKIMKI